MRGGVGIVLQLANIACCAEPLPGATLLVVLTCCCVMLCVLLQWVLLVESKGHNAEAEDWQDAFSSLIANALSE